MKLFRDQVESYLPARPVPAPLLLLCLVSWCWPQAADAQQAEACRAAAEQVERCAAEVCPRLTNPLGCLGQLGVVEHAIRGLGCGRQFAADALNATCSMLVGAVIRMSEPDRRALAALELSALQSAVERYRAGWGRWPVDVGDLMTELTVFVQLARTGWVDPWGERYWIRGCGEGLEMGSEGPDGERNTEDDIVLFVGGCGFELVGVGASDG